MKVNYETVDQALAAQFERPDLTPEDILYLTIARRLNAASDNTFAQALGSIDVKPPLNFWGKR